jgi:hypothetical protein
MFSDSSFSVFFTSNTMKGVNTSFREKQTTFTFERQTLVGWAVKWANAPRLSLLFADAMYPSNGGDVGFFV